MADETEIKLLIEAEDRSREAFEKAKRNSEELKKSEADLWRTINDGQKAAAMTGQQYFAMRQQAVNTGQQLQRSYGTQAAALQQLVTAHHAVTAATTRHGQAATSAFGAAGNALAHYVKGFATLAVAEHVIRRSITTFAEFERGMDRIQLQTGLTTKEIDHLGHSFDTLARLTGQSIGTIQKNFLTFSAEMGSSGHDVEEMFNNVQRAAFAAGTSFENMSRTAISAVKIMQVPMSEVKGMLDVVVKEVPASAMSAWENVAPRILGIMRSLGATGKNTVQETATAFGALAGKMGDAHVAGSVMVQMLQKATDQSSTFGKMMTPQMIALNGQIGQVSKSWEAMYQTMNQMGMFSDDPQMALVMQQKFGFSDEMVRQAKHYHEIYLQISEAVEKGEAWGTAEKRIMKMHHGTQMAVDGLKSAFEELFTVMGQVLGGAVLPDTLAKMITGLKNDLQLIVDAFKWIRSFTGADQQGGKSPAQATGNWFGSNLLPNWLTGRAGGAPTTALGTPVPGGPFGQGRYFGSGAVLPGFATGGEFEVGGRAGGGDKEPIGFMASPGEKVAVTTPMQESLQQQQDKADIAMREHFARFRSSAFTKTAAAPWWPGTGVRPVGEGGGGGGGGGGGDGTTPGGGGDGSNNKSGNDPPNTTTSTPFDPRTGYDPKYPGNAPAGQTPSLIGPFGQVMPAWGAVTTDPGGVYWGGGTGGGAAGGVPGLAGGPSGRALTKEERAAQADRGAPPAGGGGGGGGGGGDENVNKLAAEAGERGRAARAAHKPMAERDVFLLAQKEAVDAGLVGKVPSDGAKYGIKTGSKEEWAHFFTKLADRESSYKPWTRNDKDQGGSQGLLQVSRLDNKRYQLGVPNADTDESLHDPVTGMRVGVKLFSKQMDKWGNRIEATKSWAPINKRNFKPGTYAGPVTPTTTTTGNTATTPSATTSSGDGGSTTTTPGATQRYNYFEKQQPNKADLRVVDTPYGKITVHKDAASDYQGFYNDLKTEGAPIKKLGSYNLRKKRWGKDWSAHAYSAATDLDDEVQISPAMKKWILANPERWANLKKKWNMGQPLTDKDQTGGKDPAHVEWRGPRPVSKDEAAKIAERKAKGGTGDSDNKPATAPTNTAVPANVTQGLPGSPSGPALTREQRVAASKPPEKPPDNKPAAAPTNTKAVTAKPAKGQKSSSAVDKGKAVAAAAVADKPVVEAGAAKPSGIGHAQWGGTQRTGRPVVVGEDGPETFVPSSPGEIKPGVTSGGGMDMSSMIGEYQRFAEMMRQPIRPQIEMPRAGPIRQRMSRRVDAQRERDVGRMSRRASHSDIGFA